MRLLCRIVVTPALIGGNNQISGLVSLVLKHLLQVLRELVIELCNSYFF
jgi:hypothetical protein